MLDFSTSLFLVQDGLMNGAIYAPLAISLTLVFNVTRIVFIPQGEFVSYGALTIASLQTGSVPPTATLSVVIGICAFLVTTWQERHLLTVARSLLLCLPRGGSTGPSSLSNDASGPTKTECRNSSDADPGHRCSDGTEFISHCLSAYSRGKRMVLLIAAMALHLVMGGLGLYIFGAEGVRSEPFSSAIVKLSDLLITAQSLWIFGVTGVLVMGLYIYFEFTLIRKSTQSHCC